MNFFHSPYNIPHLVNYKKEPDALYVARRKYKLPGNKKINVIEFIDVKDEVITQKPRQKLTMSIS